MGVGEEVGVGEAETTALEFDAVAASSPQLVIFRVRAKINRNWICFMKMNRCKNRASIHA